MPNPSISPAEYKNIFVSDQPIIDVRAPIEFNKGAFPCSVNLPLMQDDERHKVGTCYKEYGQSAAIALGHTLVNGNIKQQRIDDWSNYLNQRPEAYLYCFRGGLRSQLTQQWIKEAGVEVPFIEGGYKAMRQFLIDVIQAPEKLAPMLILSGITGSGKTEFIVQRKEAVDLEGIANHRGSSFGANHEPQPTQINFENQLAVSLLKHQQLPHSCLLLEDESYLIGKSAIPKPFYSQMQQANIVVLEENTEQRMPRLLQDYVINMHQGFVAKAGEELGFESFCQYLKKSLVAIRKRLGNEQYATISQLVESALNKQLQQSNYNAHLEWISLLLEKYYDPMYQYQLSKKQHRIAFKGSSSDINQWLDHYH